MRTTEYDPFARGRFPVGVRTIQVADPTRDRVLLGEVWYPAAARHAGQDLDSATRDGFTVGSNGTRLRQDAVRGAAALPGTHPLVVFSHHSGGNRRSATYLCTHLSSHGYIVAALDHPGLAELDPTPWDQEPPEGKAARLDAWIAGRVPDVRLLLDHVLGATAGGTGSDWAAGAGARPDPARIGIVGHSFGGWTALAAPDVEPRLRAVVALAPAGSSTRKPGVIPVTLSFAWGRDVPTLYLVAENDTPLPLAGMYELFERTPAARRLVILRRADHSHFVDLAEEEHEAMRALPATGESGWIPAEMPPFAELCSADDAHLFVRGLTLGHLDATLRGDHAARRLLDGDIEAELAARGVAVTLHKHHS